MRKVTGSVVAAGLILGWWMGVGARPAAAQDVPTAVASAVKAAYLLNFARYVEWPAVAFRDSTSAVVICVVGADPFGAALDDVVRGRRVQRRPVEVRRLKAPREGAACHIAFLSDGAAALRGARAAWPARPMVFVGEGAAFAANGGTVAFVEADETIRFQINAGAARERGVPISSRVMALATRVYGVKEEP